MVEWQRGNDDWRNSTARESRRRINRSRCYARTTAEPISFRSPAASSMANGAMPSPVARWKQPWWAGGCGGPDPKRLAVSKCDGELRSFNLQNALGTNRVRIGCAALYRAVHG